MAPDRPDTVARRWVPRAVALVALFGVAAAVVGAVAGVHGGGDGLSPAQAAAALAQLDAVNRPLGERLVALRSGESARPAQAANRAAYQLAGRLRAKLSTGGDLGAALHDVLAAEIGYTDAIGSTMYNPRSPLRDRIVADAGVLRAALTAANGNPQLVRGAENFVAVARARAAGR